MFVYPEINPVAISIGPIKVHWYGLMYLLGISLVWLLVCYRARKPNSNWSFEQVSEVIFYSACGVIIGGRVGEMLFYEWHHLITDPISIFKIWTGGMSFHGGAVGVVLAFLLVRKKISKSFFEISDFMAPIAPLGLACGRIGNFINGELWGKVTNVPWAMVFPKVDMQPRHPSQLYEMLLEGILLFIVLWWYSVKPRPRMAVTGFFFLGYGVVRFFVEFFRQPEPLQGYIYGDWFTMGQLLSIPMIIVGMIMMICAYKSLHKIKTVEE